MEVYEAKRLKALEEENRKLQKPLAGANSRQCDTERDVGKKTSDARREEVRREPDDR